MAAAFLARLHARTSVRFTALVIAATLVAGIAHRQLGVADEPAGLVGRYYASADWTGPLLLERIDAELSTETLAATPELHARPVFSVEWSGFLVTRVDALQQFATKSDDGTWLWIDDELVVDNGGLHAARNVAAQVFLPRGVHRIRLRYQQAGGEYSLIVGQASHRGLFVHPGPLVPGPVTYAGFRARELWPLLLVAAWYAVLLIIGGHAVSRLARHPIAAELAAAWRGRGFRLVAMAGLAASVIHIGYGLPALQPWSGDELDPLGVLANSGRGFDGWNLRWPPLHLTLLAGALAPFDLAASWLDLSLADRFVSGCMFLVVRGVTVAMLAVTLLLTFHMASTVVDRTAGYFAVALLSLSPVVVHFGSFANLEIPHLFWVTASGWAWLQLLRRRDVTAAWLFGATVGFSLATKDQAYAYYLLAPVALVWLVATSPRDRERVGMIAVAADRRLWATAMATLLAFAIGHRFPWGWSRLVAHVQSMVSTDSVPFRMYDSSLEGYASLLVATARSFVWAAGVPLTVALVGGAVLLVVSRRSRLLVSLALPGVTYVLGFLCVIMFVYDRFLIAMLPLAAIVGGLFLSSAARAPDRPGARWRLVIPALVLLAASLNAAAQNVVFSRDPRHAAAAWLAGHVPCGSPVGVTFDTQYVPELSCFDVWPIRPGQTSDMVRYPDWLVLNEAYARRFGATASGAVFLARLCGGELGFELVYRSDSAAPRWAPLFWEPRFSNRVEDPFTVFDKPLHAIEIWRRQGARPTGVPTPAPALSSCRPDPA
ncbi:MAG: PA14 domain-containing protein [Acidobacteriota bacterium]